MSKPSPEKYITEAASCLYGGAALDHILSKPSRLRSFYKIFSPKDGSPLSTHDKTTIKAALRASSNSLIQAAKDIQGLASKDTSND